MHRSSRGHKMDSGSKPDHSSASCSPIRTRVFPSQNGWKNHISSVAHRNTCNNGMENRTTLSRKDASDMPCMYGKNGMACYKPMKPRAQGTSHGLLHPQNSRLRHLPSRLHSPAHSLPHFQFRLHDPQPGHVSQVPFAVLMHNSHHVQLFL